MQGSGNKSWGAEMQRGGDFFMGNTNGRGRMKKRWSEKGERMKTV